MAMQTHYERSQAFLEMEQVFTSADPADADTPVARRLRELALIEAVLEVTTRLVAIEELVPDGRSALR